MARNRRRFSKFRMFFKGLPVALGAYVATEGTALLSGMDITDLATLEAQAPALALTFTLGAIRSLRNGWKNREMEGSPFYRSGASFPRVPMILFCVGLALAGLSGCQSINTPDGSTITSPDLGAITTLYGFWVAEQERLEQEGIRGDALKERQRQEQLNDIERRLAPWAQILKDANVKFVQGKNGRQIMVQTD